MNTTNVTRSNSLRLIRYFEIALYASAATLLIGRIFTVTGLLTLRDSLLVLLGETLGFMASCAASPLTAALASWMEKNGPVVDKIMESTASILPFVRRDRTDGRATPRATGGRRAA